jgi:hypothetical protein
MPAESDNVELDRPSALDRDAAGFHQWMVRKAHHEIVNERFPAEEQEELKELEEL